MMEFYVSKGLPPDGALTSYDYNLAYLKSIERSRPRVIPFLTYWLATEFIAPSFIQVPDDNKVVQYVPYTEQYFQANLENGFYELTDTLNVRVVPNYSAWETELDNVYAESEYDIWVINDLKLGKQIDLVAEGLTIIELAPINGFGSISLPVQKE